MLNTKQKSPLPSGSISLGGDRHVEVGTLLGRGSMSFVHQARLVDARTAVKRPVAVKMFGTIATDDREVVESALVRSVRKIACVMHPNIAQVYEFAMVNGCEPFIVSELIRGRSLRTLMDKLSREGRRMPLDLALYITLEVAEALAGAHGARDSRGHSLDLVHGELSPRDVMLSFLGEVKVTDFGLAGARHAASSIRSLKMIAHRVVSHAPEVAAGMTADARSDVFSLGLLLREMLIGPRFTRGTKEAEVVAKTREGTVDPATFQPHLPHDLARIISTSLAVDPELRFQNAQTMAFELRRVALALGVNDMRMFLKREMQNEFAEEFSGATQPQATPPIAFAPPGRASSSGDESRPMTIEELFKGRW